MLWRVIITEQSGKDLTDYQVRVEVTDPDFFSICTDQKFVEFYDSDKQTLLNHYTELFDPAYNKAVFWVKVPSISANSTKMIYLNVNTERTEDLSNPESVFDFWDDFERMDYSVKWTLVGGAEPTIENGKLVFPNENSTIRTKQQVTLAYNGLWQFRYRWKGVASGNTPSFDFKFIFVNEDNYYSVHLDSINRSGWNRLIKIVNGSTNNLALLDFSADTNEHLIEVIRKDDGTFIVKQDGTIYAEVTDNDLTESVAIEMQYLRNTYGQGIEIDNIIVRKYTEPEPNVMVVKAGATPTLDLKKMIANCLAGKKAKILDNYPIIRLKSGDTVIKDIQAIAKHVKVDEANSRYIVMFLFIDDSSDTYTTDNQELWFPHPDGNYLAFTQTQTFEKTADEPLPLRWEIYLPYSVDELDGQII